MNIHVVGYIVEPTEKSMNADHVLIAGATVFVKCQRYRQALRAAESYLKRNDWKIRECAGGGVVRDVVEPGGDQDAFNRAKQFGLAVVFDMAPMEKTES